MTPTSPLLQRLSPLVHVQPLPASGSARKNFVLTDPTTTYVLTENDNVLENRAFIYLSGVFQQLGLPTPTVIDVAPDQLSYLQTYLGDATLSEIITQEQTESPRIHHLVQTSLDQLYHLQQATLGQVDYTRSFEYERYDQMPILHDFYYFKNFILDTLEISYRKKEFLTECYALADRIAALDPRVLMIRDFQSRNILVDTCTDAVSFIDYQTAMEGPALYDVVSMLFQAKARFSPSFREEYLSYYIQLWPTDQQASLWDSLPLLQLIRQTQVLGAYGLRGLVQRKTHFLDSLVQGMDNLYQCTLDWHDRERYPHFCQAVAALQDPQIRHKLSTLL